MHRRNIALDAARSAAATLVMIGHVRALALPDWQDLGDKNPITLCIYAVTGLGHPSVIFFFVLSGYWVGGAWLKMDLENASHWVKYGASRLTRLWIVLLPAIVVTLAVDLAGLVYFGAHPIYSSPQMYHHVAPEGLPGSLGIASMLGNILFLAGLRVPAYGGNGPLWSLSYEFWFYAWFPGITLAMRAGWFRRLLILSALVASVALIGSRPALYFSIWVAGAVLSARAQTVVRVLHRADVGVVRRWRWGAGLLLLGCALARSREAEGFVWDALFAVPCVVWVALALDVRLGWRTFTSRIIVYLADSSYSLYAIHLPLVALLVASAGLVKASKPSVLHFAAALAIAFCVYLAGIVFASITEWHTGRVKRLLLETPMVANRN